MDKPEQWKGEPVQRVATVRQFNLQQRAATQGAAPACPMPRVVPAPGPVPSPAGKVDPGRILNAPPAKRP